MSDAVNTTFEPLTRLAAHTEEALSRPGQPLATAAA
jgi:hypothetical protein